MFVGLLFSSRVWNERTNISLHAFFLSLLLFSIVIVVLRKILSNENRSMVLRRGAENAALFLLLTLHCTVAQLTKSKISVHAGGYSEATSQIVSIGRPRVIKILDTFSIASSIKSANPGIFIIGRIYLPSQPQSGSPQQAALSWWYSNNGTILSHPSVDAWEGYNEPDVSSASAMTWYSQFEVARVELLGSHSIRAVIGCFSTGTPDVTAPSLITLFNPAIDAAMAHDGILAVHEYASPFMWGCFSNVTNDGWYVGRYRKWYNQFLIPSNRTIKLIISETGIDAVSGCSGPSFAGYLAACGYWEQQGWGSDCAASYVRQLAWYDTILREDDYVMGATVFQIDCPGWANYDVTPSASALTNYLLSQK